MYSNILLFLFFCSVVSCNNRKTYPSQQYEYISVDTTKASFNTTIYVPIYSHINVLNGSQPLNLAATLSIRSMNFSDSIFISGVDYYNSKGQLVKKYLDKTLLLKPMHSADFIVEELNSEGGTGAYFIINASVANPVNDLLVQAIMATQTSGLSMAFKTEGILLKQNSP